MLPPAHTLVSLGVLPLAVGWLGSLIAILGAVTICVLSWKVWQGQRQYALELAEQARQVAEEADKAFQLLREKETLSRESQAKSEMLATLSREVRSNLNGIVGAADLMLDASLTATQREHLSTMRASAEAMHQSLNDILDYSSIETGKLRIVPAPFALREPLIEVVEHLSSLAALKELELVLIVAPDVPSQVSGDAPRLRQILLNLMSNSVRFTPSGRVVLRVEFPQGSKAATSQSATWLHFSVSDTGPGIPEEQQATLFDRYAQSDSASPRKFGGSGLDLAIAKRLVELMGGKIGVRRLPDSGSEFWAVLPLGLDATEAAPPPQLLKGLHAVVLDDLAASRVAISALLAQLGVEQDGTDSVAAASDLLRDAREAGAHELALLIDESVARDSADEVTRLLTAQAVMLGTKIILMTKDPEGAATAKHAFPTSAFLRKPVLRTDLLLKALKSPPLSAAPAGQPHVQRPPHVLVVDDDEISRSVTSQLLNRLGCKVDRAVSGAEAISSAKASRYDLIFMDCQMPEMDGFMTTEQILAASPGSAPPIVALTASTTSKDREKCFAAGMCDFVDKPARKVELDRVLKRWTRSE
jgi:two-component system sensor histidine kinase/response regulator